jgi:hypothetical protein
MEREDLSAEQYKISFMSWAERTVASPTLNGEVDI